MTRAPHSLRARLLWFLLAAISLTALVQGVMAYRTARAEADEIFDYHMQQMALSLRAGLPPGAMAGGDAHDDQGRDFVVQVWTAEGLRVFRSARAELPQRAVLGFSDVQARGSTYRVFSMQSRSHVIQVAQDMAVRRRMAQALALRTVAPVAVMAPLLMALAWWVVGSSLAPVARVRRQIAERQADDLTAVSETGLPDEVRPLVHELNLLFDRVRRAFDAQANFVADAAHELRSPLAALKLQVQGLARAGDDAAARTQAVARLNSGIDRATRLVEQLLVLARHQAGAGLPTEAVGLHDLVRQAVADATPAAQARPVDLGLTQADEGVVTGHAEPLRILLRNLLDNAVKYTPPGGTVDVELCRDGPLHLRLCVDDSGPGIAEDQRARVLDRFHRIAGSDVAGSGLGLSIVKAIAELHGASLQLDRSARLGGLRASVRFPLQR